MEREKEKKLLQKHFYTCKKQSQFAFFIVKLHFFWKQGV